MAKRKKPAKGRIDRFEVAWVALLIVAGASLGWLFVVLGR